MTLQGSENLKLSTHACLAQLDQHQTCKPEMISVVSSNPTGGNFIFLTHLNAFCTKKTVMSDLCYLRKPRMACIELCGSVHTDQFCAGNRNA